MNTYLFALSFVPTPEKIVTWQDGTARLMLPLGHPIHNLEARRLNTCFFSRLAAPDCAVCDKGFAPEIAYSCRECSRDVTRSAVRLAVAVALAVLLFFCLLFSYLWRTVHDETEEGIRRDRCIWKKNCRPCRVSLVDMLPRGAIKIVVPVWQIIYQVNECCLPRKIAT